MKPKDACVPPIAEGRGRINATLRKNLRIAKTKARVNEKTGLVVGQFAFLFVIPSEVGRILACEVEGPAFAISN
jgi:hypothetical protein